VDRNFGGVIWTKHALSRLRERGIKQGDAWATWRRPDKSRFSGKKNGWVYKRNFGSKMIGVIAKKNEKGDWIILSAWEKPLLRSNRGKNRFWSFLRKLFQIF
jgi:hypothetical protein